ncbi:hypothetical protein FK85_26350 [Halorubrum saccharovorum]|uniref:Uncharacterized protein n=1 Tax=Halorubrum saccharovorum TaxID=2248 RepID=A0A0F8D610_9EURY|nr:hypothetical protein FK85_26350 [Halorubrum saccharovorum]
MRSWSRSGRATRGRVPHSAVGRSDRSRRASRAATESPAVGPAVAVPAGVAPATNPTVPLVTSSAAAITARIRVRLTPIPSRTKRVG